MAWPRPFAILPSDGEGRNGTRICTPLSPDTVQTLEGLNLIRRKGGTFGTHTSSMPSRLTTFILSGHSRPPDA